MNFNRLDILCKALIAADIYFDSDEYKALQAAENAQRKAKHELQIVAAQRADAEFEATLDDPQTRIDVMSELVADGYTQTQAEQFTNTRAKLHQQASNYGYI